MKLSKHTVLSIFEDSHSPYFAVVNDVLAGATIISIFAIILESVPSLVSYNSIFLYIEWFTVTLFLIEYTLRLWASKSSTKYAFSFFGAVDLIAILPTIFGLGNLTFLKSARVIRIIRFLRIIRLSRISHIHIKNAEETLGIFGFTILLYAATLVTATLIFGVVLHTLDIENGRYWSIPSGMLWALSVFLGGLPVAIPPGAFGTTIFILAKFCGMALLGLLIGVVGKLFNEWVLGRGKK